MTEILTIIFAFIIFLIVLKTGYLAAIRPMSLMILIIVSLIVGYILSMLLIWLFSYAITIINALVIVGGIVLLFFK